MGDGLRELQDALARAGAGAEAVDAVAGTVIVVRDGRHGPEVLMLERPDRGSFAGAWVFPGGKVEAGDAGDAEWQAARSAGIRETWEETGLTLDADAVVALSCWEPPAGMSTRIRTWFFVAPAPHTTELTLSADETVGAEWVRPADLLDRHGRGELRLYPPTWVTLHGLTGAGDIETLLAEVPAEPGRYAGELRDDARGRFIMWAGDAEYGMSADAVQAASASRHRLRIDQLPWEYERS
ncbi:MAG TPA: NUDIX domain-containing protein [Microbacterium sp.]|uniref:NUDIX hydrolase n=1 Tax=Microbacterium sp. TaxID=51671 RepID=UPI002B4A1E1A|nr:NUDIX domain-containing protein [Microbacterium sp.]HKT57119.1 NUDIX domain-containing protein [Microbacterium sp.]